MGTRLTIIRLSFLIKLVISIFCLCAFLMFSKYSDIFSYTFFGLSLIFFWVIYFSYRVIISLRAYRLSLRRNNLAEVSLSLISLISANSIQLKQFNSISNFGNLFKNSSFFNMGYNLER